VEKELKNIQKQNNLKYGESMAKLIRVKSKDNKFRQFYYHGQTSTFEHYHGKKVKSKSVMASSPIKNIYICKHCRTALVTLSERLKNHRCQSRLKELGLQRRRLFWDLSRDDCKACRGKGGSWKNVRRDKKKTPHLKYFPCKKCNGIGYFETHNPDARGKYITEKIPK
jgi:hypothetical protein